MIKDVKRLQPTRFRATLIDYRPTYQVIEASN